MRSVVCLNILLLDNDADHDSPHFLRSSAWSVSTDRTVTFLGVDDNERGVTFAAAFGVAASAYCFTGIQVVP